MPKHIDDFYCFIRKLYEDDLLNIRDCEFRNKIQTDMVPKPLRNI